MGLKRLLDIFMGLFGNGCDEAGAGSSPSPQQKRLQPENLVSLNHEFTCKGSSSAPLTVKGWKELTMEEKMEIANGLKHPILYSLGYHYDNGSRSGRGFQRKIETFDTMGSGRVCARKAYEEGMARRGSGVSIDDVKEEVAFALLMAALEDGNTGGKLHATPRR
ncbi:hypothetical protein TB2_043387 [Malus domestica]